MADVRIVTDSACDLTDDELNELDISLVPLSIRFGAEEFTDRIGLSTAEFYKRLATSPDVPQTAAPAPGAFAEAFRGARANGASAVVCINLSSQLSATMQAAQNAATAVADEIPVSVLVSHSITAGLGTIVIRAAEAARAGATVEAITSIVDDLRSRQRIY